MNSSKITEKNFNNLLSKHVNASMISDILYEKGIDSTIVGYHLNLPQKRIFGKVSTLKIRKLRNGESPDGIYDALKSYKEIDDGDIILVETEVPERAYFGELNANLAIRSGAVGTIVCGYTRDIECVSALEYPVFSKGYCARDVKDWGTLDSINSVVLIDGHIVNPGDYIFADINGIVIIPRNMVNEVIDLAIECINKEMNVKKNVLLKVDGEDIPKITGNF